MTKFIRLTAFQGGTAIHVRADQVTELVEGPADFPDAPGETVVRTAIGSQYSVQELASAIATAVDDASAP